MVILHVVMFVIICWLLSFLILDFSHSNISLIHTFVFFIMGSPQTAYTSDITIPGAAPEHRAGPGPGYVVL